jgi:hypothetical protein
VGFSLGAFCRAFGLVISKGAFGPLFFGENMSRFLSFCLLLFFSFFALQANASTYVWTGGYPSAGAACDALANSQPHDTSDGIAITKTLTFYSNGRQAACEGVYRNSGRDRVYSGFFYRSGSSCPEGSSYNSATGGCEAPVDTPATCSQNGTFWQESSASCLASCPSGSLSHYCLNQAPVGVADTDDDGNECVPVSGGYQGILDGKHFCDSNLPEPAYCPNDQMAILTVGDNGVATFGCGQAISSPNDTPQSEQTTTTTETVGDITTITITNNQTGDTNTTTTNSSTGGSTSTTTYAGTDSETGGPCSGSSIACRPTPDEQKGFCADGGSLCDDVADIKDALDQDSDRTTLDGQFNTESANAGVVAAELALTTGLNQIKSEIGGYFDLSLSAGEIVCGGGVQVLGMTLQICPSTMKNELQVIAQIVMLISGLLSLMIIFR